jgi:MFS family permease
VSEATRASEAAEGPEGSSTPVAVVDPGDEALHAGSTAGTSGAAATAAAAIGGAPAAANGTANGADEPDAGAMAVLRNRSFLLLWLSQAATQIGGNMVLYGLTVVVLETTESKTAVSGLMLTFLVPAVLFSAVAGVYVDRLDAKPVLWVTNLLRALAIGAMIFVQAQLWVIYLLNIFVSTVTTFFSPAEAAMIPRIVPRNQLVAANSIFTITLNAAFALGFALFGSLAVTLVGPTGLIAIVAGLYFMAAVFCLPCRAPPTSSTRRSPVADRVRRRRRSRRPSASSARA